MANAPKGTKVGDVVYYGLRLSPGWHDPSEVRGYHAARVVAVSASGNVAVKHTRFGPGTGRLAPDYRFGEPFFATLEDCRAHYVALNEREVSMVSRSLTRAEDNLRLAMTASLLTPGESPAEVPA